MNLVFPRLRTVIHLSALSAWWGCSLLIAGCACDARKNASAPAGQSPVPIVAPPEGPLPTRWTMAGEGGRSADAAGFAAADALLGALTLFGPSDRTQAPSDENFRQASKAGTALPKD